MQEITANPVRFDPESGLIEGAPVLQRRLADLNHVFADQTAYQEACSAGNPLVYTVAAVEAGGGDGDLHYGLGTIYPGSIGPEYYMTKGHLHTWRDAAEVYIGLRGRGAMLLENESDGTSRLIELLPETVVYVPGHTAHRTINTGNTPLTYLGIYPAKAGHDYGAIAVGNFRMIVVRGEHGRPVMKVRGER